MKNLKDLRKKGVKNKSIGRIINIFCIRFNLNLNSKINMTGIVTIDNKMDVSPLIKSFKPSKASLKLLALKLSLSFKKFSKIL